MLTYIKIRVVFFLVCTSSNRCNRSIFIFSVKFVTVNCNSSLLSLSGKGQPGSKQPHKLTSMKQETSPVHTLQTPNQGDQAESSGDELPTLEKTTAPRRQRSIDRYSNLPRRQTSYRMAKNLDAVSRKAMMMWETSEVFSEQTTTRRKKVGMSVLLVNVLK